MPTLLYILKLLCYCVLGIWCTFILLTAAVAVLFEWNYQANIAPFLVDDER